MDREAILTLEDDTVLKGKSFGHFSGTSGEVVFNTGMVGYPETLTDPSYKGQILVMTYPMTGNYGVPEMKLDDFGLPIGFESKKIQVAGLVVSEHSTGYYHHTAAKSLAKWLEEEEIPAMFDVDTRAITKKLREKGSMLGKIMVDETNMKFIDPNISDLASQVCVPDVMNYNLPANGSSTKPKRVLLLDCGCKANIVRSLLNRGLEVIQVPHNFYFLNLEFDAVVVSNGPGDPKMYDDAIKNISRALAYGKPIFGICLGHQLLARAIGAETYKLKFGHRSHNQPCIEHKLNDDVPQRCFITSQNHGYAVRSDSLPQDWKVWFSNANDGTIEGIRHISKPFASVQFHPEATPGPVDTGSLFDELLTMIENN